MRRMSLVLLVIYILTGAQFVQCLKFDNIRCKACHGLAKRIEARLEKTEKRAGEEVGYGNRVGADGKSTSYKKELYENSQQRLMDVLEGTCKKIKEPSYCNEILLKKDEEIAKWFFEERSKTSFVDYVCEGCELPVEEDETIGDQEAEKIVLDSSISVDNNFKVEDNNSKTEEVKKKVENDDVIVEDENVKIQDEASSKEKNVKKSEDKKTKKKTEKKPENKEAKKDEKTTGESTDPISLLIGRVQGNLKRVRMLSLEIGGAISLGVRSGKWESFKKIVQDPGFVKKYWILFVFIFTIGYTIVSTILSLYPDTKAKARASGSAKKKSSSKSEKRSKSRSTGTIEVKDE